MTSKAPEYISTLKLNDIDNLTLKLCRMSDEELFQPHLINYLKPIIIEVSRNNDNRVKLYELLTHINTRIRSVKSLKMPLEPFIELYNDTSLLVQSINLVHMYIKLCFSKYDIESRIRILPTLFASLTDNKTTAQKDILIHIALPTLQHVKINDTNRRDFELTQYSYQRQYIIEFLTLILLTPYNFKTFSKPDNDPQNVPDGMNLHDLSRIIKPDITSFTTHEDLEKTKCGIVSFLTQRLFSDEEIVAAICIAHSDTRHSVVSLADKDAKVIYMHMDWEKVDVQNMLLDWFIPRSRWSDPRSHTINGTYSRRRLPIAAQVKMGNLIARSKISLPNKLAVHLSEAASVTFLDNNKNIHPKQIETGFLLVTQLCSYCSDMTDDISERLLKNLILFMQKPLDQHEIVLKVKALALLPQVLKRNHKFMLQDTNYLSQLFESLADNSFDQEIRDAIKDCLRNIAIIFQSKNVSDDLLASSKLESILYHNFNKAEDECRVAVVYFAGLVYSSIHIPTRFLLLEALGDKSKSVKNEAEHVLSEIYRSTSFHEIVTKKVRLPYFVDLVNYHGHLYNRNLFSDPVKLIPVVEYIRMCILSLEVGLTEEMKRDLVYDNVDDYRLRIYRNIQYFVTEKETPEKDSASKKALETYCKLVQVIYYTKNYFMNFLEEIIAASPKELLTKEGIILQRTKNLMLSDCQDDLFNRENCASAHSMLALEMEDNNAIIANLTTMLDSVPFLLGKQITGQKGIPAAHIYQGNALGFSYLVERLFIRQKSINIKEKVVIFLQKIDNVLSMITVLSETSNPHNSLIETICVVFNCIYALGQSGALASLTQGSLEDNSTLWPSKGLIVKSCLSYFRNSHSPVKIKEASLKALSGLCMGEKDFVHSKTILEALLQTHAVKDSLLHMNIGQAIVSVIMGPHTPFKGRWYEHQFDKASQRSPLVFEAVLKKLKFTMTKIHEILTNNGSVSRHNSAVWCLYIVQKLGWHSTISLGLLHSRILILLGDKDEMAQNAASRVLASIYDQSEPAERLLMAEELVQVILYGQRGRLEVSGEEKFTDAEMESREKNKTTYKELCTLASELNQPDLIYSFMPLASGQSQWTAKGGATTGFSHLLIQHGEDLESHIAKMVPKLFRYRFDPHPRTQKAMEQMWINLGTVTPNQELVRRCFPNIIIELRNGMDNSQPRVREASCRALRALIKHESADPLILSELGCLTLCLFRVIDDTRTEIAEVAMEAAKAIEKFCSIIMDDTARRKSIEPLLKSLVPVLLEEGLPSAISSVNKFSLSTLGVIVRSGRATIKCAIPSIVMACLQALSSQESSETNYISQHLAGTGNNESRERWDMQRVSMSKRSPLGEILTSCIRYIEEETQAQLLFPLADIVRHGVGLATRCGTAEFLVDLSMHCGSRLMGATGKLLAALLHAVLDKNEVVQRGMAKAIGCLVKYSKDSSVEKLLVITRGWYFENHESEEHQWACCHVYNCIERYAPGTLESHAATTFPLLFLAKQNEPETGDGSSGTQKKLCLLSENILKRRTIWSQTWVECVRSEGTIVVDMMSHILACISEAIDSPHYGLRTQACLTLMALVRGLCRQMVGDGNNTWKMLHDALLKALVSQVKYWPGKIYLLYAIMSFVRQLDENGILDVIRNREQLLEYLMKEINKSDINYRCVAFEAVAKVSDILDNECLTTLLPLLTPLISKGESQVTPGEREMLVRVIGYLWPKNFPNVQETSFTNVIHLLTVAMEEGQWKQQIAALKSFKCIFKKTHVNITKKLLDPDNDQYGAMVKCLKCMVKPWKKVADMAKYKQLRESCLETIEVLVNHQEYLPLLKELLKSVLLCYNNDSVVTIKEKSASLIKMIV